MFGVARVSDTTFGVCYGHKYPITVTGTIISGDTREITEGMPTARVGDTVMAACGHTGTIISGGYRHICSGFPIARLGDKVVGTYMATIISSAYRTIDNSGS